jgi:serine/threonine protein kinase
MHQKDLVHRDLKPENILFSKTCIKNKPLSDVKLIDFGLSRKFSNLLESEFPSVVGTPLYVAPEVIEELPYGKECDCWSLGVMTYFVLSGREPFFASSIGLVYDKIKKADFDFND